LGFSPYKLISSVATSSFLFLWIPTISVFGTFLIVYSKANLKIGIDRLSVPLVQTVVDRKCIPQIFDRNFLNLPIRITF
jgi:hypothetical protein